MRLLFFGVVFFSVVLAVRSDEFNAFKSYQNARKKPPQYGSQNRQHHDVKEYLTVNQLRMMKYRYGKDEPDVMFDGKFSGFDKGYNIKNSRNNNFNLRGSVSKDNTINK